MTRLSATGRTLGSLKALAVAVPLWASACTSADNAPANTGGAGGTGGSTGGAGGSGGVTGGTGGTGGATAGVGGTVTSGGSAGTGTGGAGGSVAGAAQTGGAGGAVGGSAGGVATGGTAGASAGDAGTANAMGGSAGTGQGGSGGDAAGASPGGSAGQGAWWFNGPRTPPPAGTWPPPNIKLTDVATMVTQPTAIVAPRGDTTRLYVTEKWGRIRLIKNGQLQPTPALDMRAAVLEGGPQGSNGGAELMNQGKRGLVGLAFHPNYEQNGRIFVMYVADQGIAGYGTTDHNNLYDDGDMTFAEYKRSDSNPDIFDPTPVKVFLQFDKGNCDQCSQHNGGSLEVDVDGFLWASTGDPPPYNNPGSQDLNNLNGKLLRFDISGTDVKAAGNYPGADPYVASIGIRNTYKFSVDRYTGDLYVGDVGENSWEEINVAPYGQRNRNYGWPMMEGKQTYMALACDKPDCLAPVFDYGHSGAEGTPGADNCIVGGYVYRGTAVPALQGTYLYGDYGSGKVRAIQVQNGTMVQGPHTFAGVSVFMGCFGEDAAGEMYVCDYNNNKVVRVDAQ